MRMETQLQVRQVQEMRLAPQMIQSMEILQLPVLELQKRVEQELLENPVLEAQPPQDGEPTVGVAETQPPKEEFDDEAAWFDRMSESRRLSPRASADASDAKQEMLQNTADRPQSLQGYLSDQLRFSEAPEEYKALAQEIIYNLDDNGYLPYTLEQLAESLQPPTAVEKLERALKLVQTLDPPGIGARDLKECLLLQLRDDASEDASLARLLIAGHLEDLQENRFPRIVKQTGRPLEDIKRALALISCLHPKPGSLHGGAPSPSISPDVVADYVDGRYEIRIENHYLPELHISQWHRDQLERAKTDPMLRDWLRKKMESARWLIDAIHQRQDTLSRVSQSIVDAQRPFFDRGLEYLAPLKMQQIAQQVGVHVSTVSRAISGKYIQTSRGIFPLKFFFGGGTVSAQGESESWEVIRRKVSELVTKEDGRKPLSDGDIADALHKQGIDVARRTVTKYRKIMKIPSSRRRKKY